MSSTVVVEKLMALTTQEFNDTIARIDGMTMSGAGMWSARLADGDVAVTFESKANARLGGLLEVSRALVTLTFESASEEERAGFLKRFDFAFQRGGG